MQVLDLFQNVFGHVITPSATGLLFLISGFLYFINVDGKFTMQMYREKTRKRIITLLIPYLVWNGISLIYTIVTQITRWQIKGKAIDFNILSSFWACHSWGEGCLNILGQPMPMTGPIDLPLWFLRDLIVVSLFAPVVFYLLKKMKSIFPIAMVLLYISQLWTSAPGFSIHAFMFFSVGAYMAMYKHDFQLFGSLISNSLVTIFALILTVVSTALYPRSFEDLRYVQQLDTLFLASSMIWIANILLSRSSIRFPKLISESTFYVYAVHACGIIIAPTTIILSLEKLITSQNEYLLVFLYLISPFLVYGISLLYYQITKRLFKPLMPILTGNR